MISERCQQILVGLNYPCGRAIDVAAGRGLCSFHTELAGGKPSQKNEDVPHERRPGVLAKPGSATCHRSGCGEPVYSRAMCYAHYHQDYRLTRQAQGRKIVRASRASVKPAPRLAMPCARCAEAVAIWMGGECRPCWQKTCGERRRAEQLASHGVSIQSAKQAKIPVEAVRLALAAQGAQ